MMNIKNFFYIEWVITFQCNFSCSYCFFRNNLSKKAFMYKNRGPRLPKNKFEKYIFNTFNKVGIFHKADSFDNYRIEEWIDLFKNLSKYRKNLYLSFTGGEPLIYYKKIDFILKEIKNNFSNIKIRIDTNGSVIPNFSEENIKYITYNVSFHPTQIKKETLFKNLLELDKNGAVYMVNRVITEYDTVNIIINEIKEFKQKGYYLNINPADFDISNYDKTKISLIKSLKSEIDYKYPIEDKTIGKKCIYPMFGFQLLPSGYAWIPPCDSATVYNLINNPDNILKLLKQDSIKCPSKCVCFHQYPWVEKGYKDIDIMKEYVERNIAKRDGL
jgi:organic radical activating enzyme